MKNTAIGVLAVCFFLALSAQGLCGSKPDMEPGLWEITSQTKMEGGFAMSMPATTVTQCLTQEDYVPSNKEMADSGGCRFKNIEVDGDTVTWSMECPEEGMQGKGSVVYSGDTFEGTMVMEMEEEQMKMISSMKGKRVGDCP